MTGMGNSSKSWRERFREANGFEVERLSSQYGDIYVIVRDGKRHACTAEEIILWRFLVDLAAPPEERAALLEGYANVS